MTSHTILGLFLDDGEVMTIEPSGFTILKSEFEQPRLLGDWPRAMGCRRMTSAKPTVTEDRNGSKG